MPELPEVESEVRRLRPEVTGRRFAGVETLWPRTIATGAARLRRDLPGAGVTTLTRRGKYLLFGLDTPLTPGGVSGATLAIHLRMTGRLEVDEARTARFTRATFMLDDGRFLRFEDARKFGRVFLVADVLDVVGALGPEPLDPAFTPAVFRGLFAGKARALKPLLLDQTFVAGLGNIYTDESLNLAGLHPLRRSNTLSAAELTRLHHAVRRTLERAVAHQGTSIDWAYPGGEYQNYLRVYDRAGLPCRRCRTPIVRTVVAQRGTYYCPRCQE